MNAITFAQAWDLIKRSSFQTIDGYVATIFAGGGTGDECPPFTGDPANELMMLHWSDESGDEYAMAVVEDGIAEGRVKFFWDEDSILTLLRRQRDRAHRSDPLRSDGSEVRWGLTFYKRSSSLAAR